MADMSRRDLAPFLPILLGLQSLAWGDSAPVLPSQFYHLDELPKKTNPETHIESWQVFRGQTHDGFNLACHITRLPAGQMPHPPHQHTNEEIFLIQEGTLEITVAGVVNRIGPGSLAYIHSNDLHGARNVGDGPAQYFVLELDGVSGGRANS